MNAPSDHLPRHKDDFGRVYDLEDPSPYFNALRPSEYCMPAALAGALKAIHRAVCATRGAGDVLRIVDFACGYGAIGALLRHDVSMPEIYARYGERHWRTADARSHWEADADFLPPGARNPWRSRLAVRTSPGSLSSTRPPWDLSIGPFTRISSATPRARN